MTFNPLDHLFWKQDGEVGFRDKIPNHSNIKNHKRNVIKRRKKANASAKKARRRNRKS